MPWPKKSNLKSRPLERYSQIMELLVAFPDGMSAGEIEEILRLPKTTVNRLLKALAMSDLISPSSKWGRNYVLGSRLTQFLHSDVTWIEVVTARELRMLAERTGETCFIAKVFGGNIRSVAMESPDASVGVYVVPGHELPPHASATGKLLAAFQDESFIGRALQQKLPKLTSRSISTRKALLAEYKKIRRQDYAVENGEHVEGLATIACPIRLKDEKQVIYALGLTGPAARVLGKTRTSHLKSLKETAADLGAALSVRKSAPKDVHSRTSADRTRQQAFAKVN